MAMGVAQIDGRTTRSPPSPFERVSSVGLQRNLADSLKGKRICVVIDGPDFDPMSIRVSDLLSEHVQFAKSTEITSWSTFIETLPSFQADIVIIFSPRSLDSDSARFESGLEPFKKSNPESFVAIASLHRPESIAGKKLAQLLTVGHIDAILGAPISCVSFLASCVESIESRKSSAASCA